MSNRVLKGEKGFYKKGSNFGKTVITHSKKFKTHKLFFKATLKIGILVKNDNFPKKRLYSKLNMQTVKLIALWKAKLSYFMKII